VSTVYLDIDDLLAVARAALHPQQPAVRDLGLLESALARPQASAFGVDAYPTLHEKAAALLESIARNHALIDGNKRLAWVATRLFLILNGSDIKVPDAPTGDQFVRNGAQGKLELAEVAATLREWKPREH
jgi:death-on-curing protein